MIANCVVQDGKLHSLTQVAKLKNESMGDDMISETLPDAQSTFALMGNLFVSEGKPGKVSSFFSKCWKLKKWAFGEYISGLYL